MKDIFLKATFATLIAGAASHAMVADSTTLNQSNVDLGDISTADLEQDVDTPLPVDKSVELLVHCSAPTKRKNKKTDHECRPLGLHSWS
ncbi:hypothetical protein JW319_10780 [Enterobacter cloacae subsp. cloacae]|uniref:hypothetical protein n=1 Tax=Enterobacter cloacae TaxID=550 RepID=UPI001C5B7D3A|nr:hypothetical protein [Enterobacter cloacae]MBW4201858.1 hypothetical protein [Enterobacter cloacae subsp. cloacae]